MYIGEDDLSDSKEQQTINEREKATKPRPSPEK